MRNTLASAAIGAVVGIAIAATAAVSGLGPFAGPGKKRVHATIELNEIGGECYITTTPQTLEVYRRETVEWTIVDRCGVTLPEAGLVTISFRNDPTNCTKADKKKIRCPMKSGDETPEYGFYKYVVSAPGAIPEDPELEIVQ